MIAPNYHGVPCCATCEFGCLVNSNFLAGITSPVVSCDKYGLVMPGGICDDWEDD